VPFFAVLILGAAVVAGLILAFWHMRASEGGVSRPPSIVGIAHGIVGVTGLAVLLFALRGPVRGAGAGVGSFGQWSAWLLIGALLAGLLILIPRQKVPTVSIVIHGGLAITGYVLLVAWDALG